MCDINTAGFERCATGGRPKPHTLWLPAVRSNTREAKGALAPITVGFDKLDESTALKNTLYILLIDVFFANRGKTKWRLCAHFH